MYCEHCGENPKTKFVIKKEGLPVLGDGITTLWNISRVCKTCGSGVWDNFLEGLTLKRAFRKYYRKNKDKKEVVAWYKNRRHRQKTRRKQMRKHWFIR